MNVLTEILRGFLRNVLLMGAGFWAAFGLALVTGAPQVPLLLAGLALGFVASVLAYRSVHEPLLRRATHRPHRTMTPEDYRRLREMEIELGREPSETPTPLPPATGTCSCPPDACAPVGIRIYDYAARVIRYYGGPR